MLDRARQRRAALEARLSNSDLSAGHAPAETNHGVAWIVSQYTYQLYLLFLLPFANVAW